MVAPPGIPRRKLRQALSEDKPFAFWKATSPATGAEHQHGVSPQDREIL